MARPSTAVSGQHRQGGAGRRSQRAIASSRRRVTSGPKPPMMMNTITMALADGSVKGINARGIDSFALSALTGFKDGQIQGSDF